MQRSSTVLFRLLVAVCAVCFFVTLPTTVMAKQKEQVQKTEKGKEVSIVDINEADVATLTNLPGVGQKTAEGIVSYRNEHGPFQSIDDLKNVKGIGDKKMEKLKSLVTVSKKKEISEKAVKDVPAETSKMASKKP